MPSSTLAARCPACLTVFRVVPDQLRVSQGWVRCGRCAEVFNATLALVDAETGAPRKASEALSPREMGIEVVAAHEEPEWAQPAATGAAEAAERWAEPQAPEASPDAAPPSPVAPTPTPHQRIEPGFDPAAPEAERAEPSARAGTPEGEPTSSTDAQPEAHAVAPALVATDAPSEAPASEVDAMAPSFVRKADRAARWRQPRVRAALAALGSLSLLVLLGQVLFEYRDLAAARFPGVRPALVSACAALGCEINAARAINSLAVESSGLVRIERSSIYRLQVALRNRAGIEVALPAFDLSFTDNQGRLIARKVLRPEELGATQATLGAGRELALQTTLQAGAPEPIAGYTIELFYP